MADTGSDVTVEPPPIPTVVVTQGPQTGQTQPEVQGLKDEQTSQITVFWTQDFVTFNIYCNVPAVIGATVWFCPSPNGSPLPVGSSSLVASRPARRVHNRPTPRPLRSRCSRHPVITSPTTGTHTNDPTPSFSGTALGGSTTVQLRTATNDIVCFPVAVVGGNWACDSDFLFPDGAYEVRAIAGPATNNTSAPIQLTIDTVAPGAPTITGPGTLNGPTLEYSTAQTTATVEGFGEAFAEINLYVDGAPVACVGGPLISDSDGLWACQLDTLLSLGQHGISASQIDLAGNAGPASAETLEITRTAAEAPVNTPVFTHPAPGPDPDNQPFIEGDIGLEDAAVDVVVTCHQPTGSRRSTAPTQHPTQPRGILQLPRRAICPYGEHTFTATSYFTLADPGHTTPSPTSAPLVYTRIGMDPVNVTTAPLPPPVTTTEARLDFAGTGPQMGTLEVYVMNQPGFPRICGPTVIPASGNWSCEGTPLAPGVWDIMVLATDGLGNATFDGPHTVQIVAPPPT